MKMRELIEAGLDPTEARREARRRFGSVAAIKERTRDMDIVTWIDSLWSDVRFALRALARSRTATAVAVLTLALGIAANTTIFGLVNAIVLEHLPYAKSDRLVIIGAVDSNGREDFANHTDIED